LIKGSKYDKGIHCLFQLKYVGNSQEVHRTWSLPIGVTCPLSQGRILEVLRHRGTALQELGLHARDYDDALSEWVLTLINSDYTPACCFMLSLFSLAA
jgi:hypothetical protein